MPPTHPDLPLPARPRIAILGAGAAGAFYGALLQRAGHDVHYHMRSDADHVRRHGLLIHSPDHGEIRLAQVAAYAHPADMPPPDVVLIFLKSTANADLPQLLAPLLRPHTLVLSLQNGIGIEDDLLAAGVPPAQIAGGLAYVCANRIAPGEIDHIGYGLLRIGELLTPPGPRATSLAKLLSNSGIQSQTVDHLPTARWHKLVWNVAFNGLGALLNLTTGQILARPPARQLLEQLMAQTIAIAAAIGIRLPPDLIPIHIARTTGMGDYRTSMQMDRQAARPMEIEAIIGRPLKIARQHAVPAPDLEFLHHALRSI